MAGLFVASYTARETARQPRRTHSRPASIAALVLFCLGLGGCAVIRPLSAWTSSSNTPPDDELTTGSIAKPAPSAAVPVSDGEVVRRTIEATRIVGPARVEWKNAASGNSGTITELVEARAKNGAPCRDFATTFATVDGVRMYRGRACQGYVGPWDLVEFGPVEPDPAG